MAGRPKGIPKTGGRQKGSRNKASYKREKEIAASGLTPLDYMLKVMRESNDDAMRLDAAKSAAPYIHPKLANINHSGPDGGPLQVHIVRYSPAE